MFKNDRRRRSLVILLIILTSVFCIFYILKYRSETSKVTASEAVPVSLASVLGSVTSGDLATDGTSSYFTESSSADSFGEPAASIPDSKESPKTN